MQPVGAPPVYPESVTDLISFPFRLDPSGAVATRDDGSDEYLAEELAQLIQTNPGERELVPTYGLNDPTYAEVDQAMLAAQVATFGPPVQVQSVTTRFLSDEVQDVVVEFEALPDDPDEDDPLPASADTESEEF